MWTITSAYWSYYWKVTEGNSALDINLAGNWENHYESTFVLFELNMQKDIRNIWE